MNQQQQLGARVRDARHARGWTIADLAEAAGVATGTANSVELGRKVRPGNLRAVLDALDIPPVTELHTTRSSKPEDVQLATEVVEQWLTSMSSESARARAVLELTRFVMGHQGDRLDVDGA